MAIDEKTKQVGAQKRARNESLIAKLTKEKAAHQASIADIDAQLKALDDENKALKKDIPDPAIVEPTPL